MRLQTGQTILNMSSFLPYLLNFLFHASQHSAQSAQAKKALSESLADPETPELSHGQQHGQVWLFVNTKQAANCINCHPIKSQFWRHFCEGHYSWYGE